MQRQERLISRVTRKTYPDMSQNQSYTASSIVVMHYVLGTFTGMYQGGALLAPYCLAGMLFSKETNINGRDIK